VRPDCAEHLQRLIAGFRGPIARPPVSILYRTGLAAVAVAMVVLPILYIALAVAAAWAVLVLDTGLINSGLTGRTLLFGLLAVTVGGGAAVASMFKPLFAPRPRAIEAHPLSRDDEPVLYGFVDHLCGVLGAPKPTGIDVACQVNAAASFRRGMLSFLGPDLKLTIGLPLVAGLTLRQFTGVLAHEFGHFSQGTGMRLTYVIRSVNYWFARVVYERDAWDEGLARWSSAGNGYVMAIAGVARGAVWTTRRVLWALMMAGHAISCFALRQMEYDADAHETQVAGSDVFESTSLRISELGVALQAAHGQLSETWRDRRLVDNLPALVAQRVSAFDAATLQAIREQALGRATGSLDTHPADADRIAAARRIHAAGVFGVDAPADTLFARFDALSHDVTRQHYARMIGDAADGATFETVQQLTAGSQADGEAGEALAQVIGPVLPAICTPAFGAIHMSAPAGLSSEEAVEALRGVIQEMRDMAAGAGAAMTRFDKLDDQLIAVEQSIGVAEARASGRRAGSSPTAELAGLRETHQALQAESIAAGNEFAPYARAAARRIELAIGLIRGGSLDDALGEPATDSGEIELMLQALEALQQHEGDVRSLRVQFLQLHGVLIELTRDPKSNQDLVNPIKNATRALANRLVRLRASLLTPYPFERAQGKRSLGSLMIQQVPPSDDIGGVVQAAQSAINQAFGIHRRLLAHLCRLARRVEAAVAPGL
jgi:hypothetical protein